MVLTMMLAALLSISFADAAIPNAILRERPSIPKIPIPEHSVTSLSGAALPPITTIYYFDQLIDHNNPGLGTFQQRYWMDWEFYQAGGPIIFMTPGEVNAEGYEGYLTNGTINGMIAQQQQGATIVIEHHDLVYFAQTADLPMPGGDNVKSDTTPWILVGGSYSGALTSWTMVNQPGVFYAGYASSGVVEAITDYYGYFTPIREYMPRNCSSDVQAVIAYLDLIYAENNTAAVRSLKESFGLGSLSHIDDFAAALRHNLFDWQSLQPDTGAGADGVIASTTGWGLENAIYSWGSFWNNTYYVYLCGTTDAETCLGTHDAGQSHWTDVTVNNANRSWFWMVCNQFGFYQVGPPEGQSAIMSRILQPVYEESKCVHMFPQKFTSPPSPSAAEVNSMYGGWNATVNRLLFANGLRDPWREATVSANDLDKPSTTTQPVYVSDGFHCSDLLTENGMVDETVNTVQAAALEYMKKWLA